MRISAIIPTFNRREHVFRAIDSVLAQTLPADEIIVVDDGSTDFTTEAILEHYGSKISVVRQENKGAAAARARAVERAKGEWVAFLDSDDTWLPEKLERQFKALTELGNEFGVCFTNCAPVGDTNPKHSAFARAGLRSPVEFGPLENPIEYFLVKSPAIYLPSLLVLRSLIEGRNGFDEAMVVEEDTDLIFRLTFRTRFCFVSVPLVTIDRTASRSVGLIELYAQRDERVFESSQHKFKKWLALPDLVDPGIRRRFEDHLRTQKYDWTIARLYRLKLLGALQKIKEIRAMGDSYATIFFTLLSRAAGKIFPIGRSRSYALEADGEQKVRRDQPAHPAGNG